MPLIKQLPNTFQSTLPARGATAWTAGMRRWMKFQSTLPARGATGRFARDERASVAFQSTLPARGATWDCQSKRIYQSFQSTLPARGATTKTAAAATLLACISIHAPRTGSDSTSLICQIPSHVFQSTLPARGATAARVDLFPPERFQSTLPARGATNCSSAMSRCSSSFQSTLPARGATCSALGCWRCSTTFQSTLPARGATALYVNGRKMSDISIHAPRTGSDGRQEWTYFRRNDFNPRSPHGERQRKVTILSIRIIGFAQKVYHKTVLLRISLAENAVILPEKPRNPVRTSLQKAGGLRFARAIRAARPYSISSPSGA